jgi:hypothetical protein
MRLLEPKAVEPAGGSSVQPLGSKALFSLTMVEQWLRGIRTIELRRCHEMARVPKDLKIRAGIYLVCD